METVFQVRSAYRNEWQEAMALAWKTFLRFEADVYTPEGVENFRNFVTDSTLYRMFVMGSYQLFVAVEHNRVVGMITLREAAYHRRGIGRALIRYLSDYLVTEMGVGRVTVNASPYGVEFYHKMGFRDLGPEETKEGITYTPMEFIL